MRLAMRLPFSINQAGYVATTTDPGTIVTQRVLSAIGTRFGERMMRGDYGSLVPEHILGTDLNPNGRIEPEVLIELEAASALARYVPDVSVREVQVEADRFTAGQYAITVRFSTDPNGANLEASIVVSRDLLAGTTGS